MNDSKPDSDACGSGCADDLPQDLSNIPAGYRRALWIVVSLNLGYGLVEMVGGFFADSQALKADALDFLGDGTITLLGLIAVAWSASQRARLALTQGIFLGAMGVGVFAVSLYRTIVLKQPEAELMGGLGAIALVINVVSAVVLIPHRSGDSSVRAVWLFSRNDAIGNVFVVVAAALVAWTATPWPDILAAMVIAGLFIHSASSIVRHALRELRTRHSAQA